MSERPPRGGAGPPRLRFDLLGKLKLLLLANIIPIGLVGSLAWGLWSGELELRPGVPVDRVLTICGVLLIGCLTIGVSTWIVLPLAAWLRDYPAWRARRGSAVWLVPAAGGWLTWFLTWVLVATCATAALLVIGTGVWSLGETAHAVRSR